MRQLEINNPPILRRIFFRLRFCCEGRIADYVTAATKPKTDKKASKERAWNNLNNYGAGFLVLTKRYQEAHSCSTQRLRSFCQGQKDKPKCSSYFMHVPKVGGLFVFSCLSLKNKILCLLPLLILEACVSSQSTNFYQLKPIASTQLAQNDSSYKKINIFIKPVKFPDYLDRPQMVTRNSEYKLQLSEYNRWAEPLKENFSRVFIENLNTRITLGHVLEYSDLEGIKPDFQLSIEVLGLDVNFNNQAILKVKWTLMAGNNMQWINRYHDEYSFPVDFEKSVEAGVEAQSKAVALFADKVAATIQSIHMKAPVSFESK